MNLEVPELEAYRTKYNLSTGEVAAFMRLK